MHYSLITGASSGIGLALAERMAQAGHNLLLVARRGEILLALKRDWEDQYKVRIETRAMDLSIPGQAQSLYDDCRNHGITIDYLVNNAGFGDYGDFEADKLDTYRNMLQLNIVCLTELTALFAQDMKQRGFGRILNVGSIAGFLPMPTFAVYAASKAFVMQFTEAINYEMRGSGVTATLLSPGMTETGFVERANMAASANAQNGLMDAKTVAEAGYKAMCAGQLNVIPGWKNQLMALGSKSLPSREALLLIASSVLKNTAKEH